MLKQIKIENFRCFKSFELNQLGRVNLLVGKNNSGKTSILEAIQLLCSDAENQLIKQIMINRGEYFGDKDFDVSYFFYKYEINPDKPICLSETNQKRIKKKESKINNLEFSLEKEFFFQEIREFFHKKDRETYIRSRFKRENEGFKNKFVASLSLTTSETIELFNQIVLTLAEDLVYEALQIIEPKIQRIAPIETKTENNDSRGGFLVRLSDTQKRIPIGSMGDGIWRMLGLSLALVSVKDGVLLVDEIDTGLHYTVQEDMWKLVWETAKKLNVQVFATTHSSDCWTALEVLANRDDVGEEDISIQRIEKDTPRSIVYNKKGIATAAKREIEVR